MRRISNVLFGCALLAVLTRAGEAGASSTFPAVVKEVTGDPNTVPCTYCHTDPGGGLGTANTAFGKYLRSRSVVMRDTASLQKALATAEVDPAGMAFIAALRLGHNPNPDPGSAIPSADYGCGAHVAPRGGTTLAAPLFFAAGVLGALRRRNKRRVGNRASAT